MGALSETYVDPARDADVGNGTIGDPFGDLQYALNTMSRDTSNGDRVNIKSGVDEILLAPIDLSSYGSSGPQNPLLFEGYDAIANDNGIGGISGGDAVSVHDSTSDYIHFKDLHCHSTGSSDILKTTGDLLSVVNCELDNTTGSAVVLERLGMVTGCNIHNIEQYGVAVSGSYTRIFGNYFKNGANKFSAAIYTSSQYAYVYRNVISIDGASDGIRFTNTFFDTFQNSILSNNGSGSGIVLSSTNNKYTLQVLSNIIEGFANGGYDIDLGTSVRTAQAVFRNAYFNNTSSRVGDVVITYDNEILPSSGFAKVGLDTFENRGVYFEPLDVGNIIGTDGRLDKGAVQSQGSGGGTPTPRNRGILTGGRL